MCESIRTVTLTMNSFVPVVVRRGPRFDFNFAGPGILARWLIKMAVDNKCSHQSKRMSDEL